MSEGPMQQAGDLKARPAAESAGGLFTIMAFGPLVESPVFRTIERRTVRGWALQHG